MHISSANHLSSTEADTGDIQEVKEAAGWLVGAAWQVLVPGNTSSTPLKIPEDVHDLIRGGSTRH